ncbi:Calcium-binding ef-hand [Thalictrum thalictroides]|uniref:Calcium-binding ef-hand n=1 Tax=Thalictrum thalictroides TaxID=46969 RepID=A0A7J6V942_THATH|nr:Calcium-binding ef-hand [Thalictrum thalictroides]
MGLIIKTKEVERAVELSKCFPKDNLGSGVSVDIWTAYGARIMIISVLPFIVVQVPEIFHVSNGRRLAVLSSLFVAVALLVSYCLYQVFQPVIQQRKLAFVKHKHVISGTLRHLKTRALGRLVDDDGQPNEDVIRKLFRTIDLDGDSLLSPFELRSLIIIIQFEEIDLDHDDAVQNLMKDFDTSGDNYINEDEFFIGISKWLNEAKRSVKLSCDPGIHTMTFLDHFHLQTKQEHDLLFGDHSDEVVESIEDAKWVTIKASMLLLLGIVIAGAFADPLVHTVNDLSTATGIPSFFVSFIGLPLVMNSSEATSALMFASRKKKRTSSLTFSEIYGSVTIHNLLCLAVFLAIVYVRDLTWDFSAEVLIIVIVCIVMGLFASFRTIFPLWTCLVAYGLYPFSLVLVYVLDYGFGWS